MEILRKLSTRECFGVQALLNWANNPSPVPPRLMEAPEQATLSPWERAVNSPGPGPASFCQMALARCPLPAAYCLLPTAYFFLSSVVSNFAP